MNPSGPKKRFNLSLSTKFILFAGLMEILLVVGSVYTAYVFLSEQRIQHVQNMLVSQVNLLAREFENQKDNPNQKWEQLELNTDAAFQIVSLEGQIFWDSKVKSRIRSRITGPHELFDLAKSDDVVRKRMTFHGIDEKELFYGSYKKVPGYVVMAAIPKSVVYKDTYFILEKLLYLGGLLCGVAFLIIVYFAHRIIKPIRGLTSAAIQISKGNFNIELDTPSNDELGILSESFSTMAQQVKVLLQEESSKVRMKQEMSSVAQIQHSLLPASDVKTDRYDIQSYYQSAAETGGDCWGYFSTSKHLVVYIADATGHGLTSAMLTVAARGCFATLHRLLIQQTNFVPLPSQLLAFANDAVLASAQKELNMTMFVAMYSYEDRRLTYANAGHNPAWIVRKTETETRIEVLKGSGVRLGEGKDFPHPEDKVVVLGEDDTLFLYTDGLLDCENAQQEQLGKNRVKDLLIQKLQSGTNLETVRDHIVETFMSFTDHKPIDDDITFALVKPHAHWRGGSDE